MPSIATILLGREQIDDALDAYYAQYRAALDACRAAENAAAKAQREVADALRAHADLDRFGLAPSRPTFPGFEPEVKP